MNSGTVRRRIAVDPSGHRQPNGARHVAARPVQAQGIRPQLQFHRAADLLELDSGALVPSNFVVSNADGVIVVDTPEGLFDLE